LLLRAALQVHARMFRPEPAAAGASSSNGGSARSSMEVPQGDVRELLRSVQREVLRGVRITFSRIIPQGDPAPELHHIWRLAEQVLARPEERHSSSCHTCHWSAATFITFSSAVAQAR
jgi:hypothetical protein